MPTILRAGCTRWDITVYKPEMVSLALLLLTVSTLAIHGDTSPTEQAITHECEGSTLCGVKPAGYPQEEIDRLVLQQLPHLHRMKRQAPWKLASMEPAAATIGGNCAIEITSYPVYTIKKKQGLPKTVVQSKWFNQNITEVRCKNDESKDTGCLSSLFTGSIPKTKCINKFISIQLTAFDMLDRKFVTSSVEISVDCICVISDTTSA